MPRTCTICRHERRKEIEGALAAGDSHRAIAGRFKVAKSSVERHQAHVAEEIKQAQEAGAIERAVSLTDQLNELRTRTERVLAMSLGALSPTNGELVLKAIARREKQIEIEARLRGEFLEEARNPKNLTDDQLAAQIAGILDRARRRAEAEAEGVM